MAITDPELQFINIISNRDTVEASVRTQVLGGEKIEEYKVRTEPDIIRHVEDMLEKGNRHLKSCTDIVKKINIERSRLRREHSVAMGPLNVVVHDKHAAFDSEAGVGKCGTIFINVCARYGWLDKNGDLWAVPTLLVMFHELGHYLQYVTNRGQYEAMATIEAKEGHHLLDALNLPDNEYPICRELGMGIRQLYTDMHELAYTDPSGKTIPGHPSFKDKAVHCTRLLRDDPVFPLGKMTPQEEEEFKAQEKRRLETKLGGGQMKVELACACGQSFQGWNAVKQRGHKMNCEVAKAQGSS